MNWIVKSTLVFYLHHRALMFCLFCHSFHSISHILLFHRMYYDFYYIIYSFCKVKYLLVFIMLLMDLLFYAIYVFIDIITMLSLNTSHNPPSDKLKYHFNLVTFISLQSGNITHLHFHKNLLMY